MSHGKPQRWWSRATHYPPLPSRLHSHHRHSHPPLPWEGGHPLCPAPEVPLATTTPVVDERSILVIDDHPPIREWLTDLLAPLGIAIIPARSGDEALALLRDGAQIRAALCDVLMPHAAIEGIEAARTLWHDHGIPCLMLTSVQDASARLAALYAGAFGYLCKDFAHGSIVRDSVTALLAGRPLPEVGAHLSVSTTEVQRLSERSAAYARAMEQLTPQQRVVAQLLQEGKTNREIAEQLVLSRGTVNSHVSHILERLNLSTRREVRTRVLFISAGHRTTATATTTSTPRPTRSSAP